MSGKPCRKGSLPLALRRGFAGLAVIGGVTLAAGLAGWAFRNLNALPAGGSRTFLIFGAVAIAAGCTIALIHAGSRLFLRVAGPSDAGSRESIRESRDRTRRVSNPPAASGSEPNRLFGLFAVALAVPFYAIYFELFEQVARSIGAILSIKNSVGAIGGGFAAAVALPMLLLAIGDRPEDGPIRWGTVLFAAALWPVALTGDFLSAHAPEYGGYIGRLMGLAPVTVMVLWFAVGAALRILDFMFTLARPELVEDRLRGLAILSNGWMIRHALAFYAVYYALTWLIGRWDGTTLEGAPAYFVPFLAGLTIAFCRPRGGRDWILATLASAGVAILVLSGVMVVDGLTVESPAAGLALHILSSLPALALGISAIWYLSPRLPDNDGTLSRKSAIP